MWKMNHRFNLSLLQILLNYVLSIQSYPMTGDASNQIQQIMDMTTLGLFFLEPDSHCKKKKEERLFFLMETGELLLRVFCILRGGPCGKGHRGWKQSRSKSYIIVFD